MKPGKWNCTSEGPQNNGLLKNCEFAFCFDDSVKVPHCPLCASSMIWKSAGKTITEILREGLLKEKKDELSNKKLEKT